MRSLPLDQLPAEVVEALRGHGPYRHEMKLLRPYGLAHADGACVHTWTARGDALRAEMGIREPALSFDGRTEKEL